MSWLLIDLVCLLLLGRFQDKCRPAHLLVHTILAIQLILFIWDLAMGQRQVAHLQATRLKHNVTRRRAVFMMLLETKGGE